MNFDSMKLPDLKSEAKARKIKGYSTMNKPALIEALKATEVKPSMVEAIKAAIRNEKDARKLKGAQAGREGKVTEKQSLSRKREVCGSKMTAAQARRYRKAVNAGAPAA